MMRLSNLRAMQAPQLSAQMVIRMTPNMRKRVDRYAKKTKQSSSSAARELLWSGLTADAERARR